MTGLDLAKIPSKPAAEGSSAKSPASAPPAASGKSDDEKPKTKKAKRKINYPTDPVRHNPAKAAQKRIRQAIFRGIVDCSLMERERYDYLTHMHIRSQTDHGPKFRKDDLRVFRVLKGLCRGVLEPRCMAHENVTAAEYKMLKTKASQMPHIRYLTCPCITLMDVLEPPLPPLYPPLRTPTFQ